MADTIVNMRLSGGWRFLAAIWLIEQAALLRLISADTAMRLALRCGRLLKVVPD